MRVQTSNCWYDRSVPEEKSMASKECPLCGTPMRLVARTVTTQIPGVPVPRTTTFDEWICPDCDYFEEAEEPEDEA